jgi:hypothetical protein
VKFSQHLGHRACGHLGIESGQLRGAQRMALRIGQQAVQRARDMTQMKGYWWKRSGTGEHLGVGQGISPTGCVFTGELERMEDGAPDGVNVR